MKRITLLAIVFTISLFNALSVNAQVFTGSEAAKLIPGTQRVMINESRKSVSFIELEDNLQVPEAGAQLWLAQALKLESGESYDLLKSEKDNYGYVHYRYQQYHRTVPVEYGVFYVHTKNGRVVSANGERYEDIRVNTQPVLSLQQANAKALEYFQAQQMLREQGIIEAPKLVVLPLLNNYHLTYKFDLYAEIPHKRAYIYVDAHSGKVVRESDRITDGDAIGTGITLHNGPVIMTTDSMGPTSFRLRETGRGNGINTLNLNNGTNYGSATDFTDTDNNWTSTVNQDHAANDAHFGAEKTYDFFFDNFGRNSYDNAGAVINSYVHYSTNYVNAFWNGTNMTYGDGDGTQYLPLTSLEIIAHEITHAVTENTAGLIYAGESGALNESFSDVFGNTVRFLYSPGFASWDIGDQIVVPGGGATPFRSMTDPNLYDCADTYGGLFWNNGDIVHYDSGVQNYWYYLLCDGGSGTNDIGNAFLVNGIGMNDAMAIAYRNLSVYLTPNSTFMDARNGAIQSAIDLFGPCSNQVVQTSNAWYAVGVGGLFSNSVVAGLTVQNNFYCVVPATVPFVNTSLNATSFQWDFGDGGTSTATNPSHTYTAPGVYTVTLIAQGAGACTTSDTIVYTGLISLTNGGGPVTASCTPATTSYCCGVGILNFQFNTINKTSANASEGYKDFTCSNSTTITAGDAVAISVTTGNTTAENVKAFIDYNNDGVFNNTNEVVFVSSNQVLNHFGVVNTPVTATLNTPLRMRIMDDQFSNPIANACTNLNDGQAEDYTVTFIANTLPPIVDFTSDVTTVNTGGSVQFYDLSINAPTAWEWQFPGGTPATSVVQNPSITYNTVGVYPVQLKVTNSFGVDSVLEVGYISVVNFVNMCTGVTTTTALNGLIYDSGGPTGDYQNGENCSLLIQPFCADTIRLSFTMFQTESGWDDFNVYDGTSAASPLLLSHSGNSIPPTVVATSGAMFIRFTSDGSVVYDGWAGTWSTVTYSTTAPVADFQANDTTPALNADVQFTDLSANAPNSWIWDFGDGNSSTVQNPVHAYTSPGLFSVQLIAFTCSDSDTITKFVTVQQAPVYSAEPDSINVSISCGDSIVVPIMIVNSGAGDLTVESSGTSQNVTLNVLALQYGTDLTTEYPNTISAINQFFTNYTLSTVNTTSPSALQTALIGKDVFLMTEPENGTPSVYAGFAPVLQSFVNNGGNVIFCGADNSQSACIFNTGLFAGSFSGSTNSGLLNIVDPLHPVMDGVVSPLTGTNATFVMNFSNPDAVPLVTFNGNEVVAYRTIGDGRAVYVGFDYFSSSINVNRVVSNAVRWAQSTGTPPWVSIDPDSLLVSAGDTSYMYVTLNSTGLDAGTYTYNLILATNDPLVPFDTIPVSMTISGPSVISLSDTCIHFGSMLQNATTLDSMLVVNQGCDTLIVSSITSSQPEFTVVPPTSWSLAPHDSTYIVVSFMSPAIGSYSGTLTILNNDADTTICMTAITTGAPQLEIEPDSLQVSLNCNDSITVQVMVINSGLSDLEVSLEQFLQNDTLEVLALLYGTDLTTEYPNTIDAIDQYFTDYNLSTVNTTSATALQAALVGKDVFLMTEAENGSASVYTSFAPVLQNFVDNGGNAVICGADASQSACIFNTGLFSGVYASNPSGIQLTIVDPTHPILDGVVAPIVGTNATYVANMSNLDIVPLVSYLGNEVVAYRPIGDGNAVYVAFDYFATNNNVSRIVSNAVKWAQLTGNPPWISVGPDSLLTAPGDTSYFYVTLNSAGLNAGIYTYNIVVSSNDPLNPFDTIPVTMTVSGPAVMVMGDTCIHFGTMLQNSTALDSVWIVNTGCDTLDVTSITSSMTEFTLQSPASWSLAPDDSTYILVEFSSAAVGTFNGLLTILNNGQDTTICMTATTLGAPLYDVDPDSINVTLNCGDSITVPLTIYNLGLSDLYFDINSNSNSAPGDTSVLVIQESTAWGVSMSNFLQTEYGITPTVINSSQIPATDFTLYDMVITVGDESAAYYSNISNNVAKFNAYVSGGGLVQHQMATTAAASNVNIAGGGIMTYGNNQNQNIGLIPGHPILNGMTNPLNGNNANHCYLSTLPTGATVITETQTGNFPTTVEYDLGSGKVMATGMTWEFLYINAYNSELLLPNSTAYMFSQINVIPDWLSYSPTIDTVPAGDSTIVYVTINSVGLDAGTYTAFLVVATNDPLNPFDTIPVTMNIGGPSMITLGDTCLHFGTILQNATAFDSVLVVNQGCDTLVVSSITTSQAEFTVQPPVAWSLAPHDSTYIVVSFSSAAVGTYNGSLTILNNDQDTTICLTGATVGAPHIEIDPDSIAVTMSCSDSITIPVMIINTGLSDLDISLQDFLQNDTLEVLALTYGTDLGTEYPNTIAAINQYFTNYNLTTINTTSSATLQTALVGKDVFLMTEPESGSPAVYTGFATVLQNFVNNGGNVVLCGADVAQAACIFNTGLLSGSYATNGNSSTLTIVDPLHPILDGVIAPLTGTNATYVVNLTNANSVPLVTHLGNEVVAYRPVGDGMVVFLAFDYYATNANVSRIVSNAVKWAQLTGNPPWMSVTPDSSVTAPGDTSYMYVTLNSAGLTPGTYTYVITISTNDPLNPTVSIPVSFTISGAPCVNYTFSVDSCGTLVAFTDGSTNGPTSWLWDFGDGTTATTQNPSHLYANSGTYNVMLVACNAQGCDSLEQTVVVTANISAAFSYTGSMMNTLPIQFTDNSVGAVSWLWDFGDGNLSVLQNPVHIYLLPGTYVVTLEITAGSCIANFTDTLIILPVGLTEVNGGNAFIVYPNPAEEDAVIQFTLDQPQVISLVVYDGLGKKITTFAEKELLSPGTHQYILDVEAQGNYLIIITGDSINETLRFSKIK